MMKIVSKCIVGCLLLMLLGCDAKIEDGVMKSDLSKDVEMVTDYGTIIMRLSDETPKHRNNFIKLVNQKFYDSVLFHRVIENFLVQTGDHKTKPLSLNKSLDSVSLPSAVQSEFRSNLFHKRGALNAAREGDYANPSRSSHGSQFTIIQGSIQTDTTLNYALKRVNFWQAKNNIINRPAYKKDLDKYTILSKKVDEIDESTTNLSLEQQEIVKSDFEKLKAKIASYRIDSLANIELEKMQKYSYPKAHRDMYKTIGGAPHLDQNYTVFGEVLKGMNVVDSIAAVVTNKTDKPIKDVYILKARMIERKSYND